MKNKKGQLSLDTIGKVMIVVLTLAVMAIAVLLILTVISSRNVLPQSTLSTTAINETGWINVTGYRLDANTTRGFESPSIVAIINKSGSVIAAGNYSLSSVGLLTNNSVVEWNDVNITYTYKYNTRTANDGLDITQNVSNGTSSFFQNVPTIFTVLGVTIIIVVIGLIIGVVRRIRETSSMSYT